MGTRRISCKAAALLLLEGVLAYHGSRMLLYILHSRNLAWLNRFRTDAWVLHCSYGPLLHKKNSRFSRERRFSLKWRKRSTKACVGWMEETWRGHRDNMQQAVCEHFSFQSSSCTMR